MSDTKLIFTRLSQADAEAAATAEQPQHDDHDHMCKCAHAQPNRGPFNVTLEIEDGRVNAVLCATCELPCVISDDLELVEAASIPARLTITVEKYSTPIAGDETDYFLVLDAQEFEAGE